MSGKKIGYILASSFEQNSERQLEGISLNKKPFYLKRDTLLSHSGATVLEDAKCHMIFI
ncbi:MAG: hypothetical protein H0U75_06670 [Legionella sp.]|nr:hypothetical protein [Legionella sp.]